MKKLFVVLMACRVFPGHSRADGYKDPCQSGLLVPDGFIDLPEK